MIDWINTIFTEAESEMKGLEWGRLYETYHSNSYNPTNISSKVRELYADPCIKTRRGIFEYILGGCTETKLLECPADNMRFYESGGVTPQKNLKNEYERKSI